MLGTLVYMILDVSFNVLLWSSQKAIEGSSILGEQIIKTYQEMNKPHMLMIEENVKIIDQGEVVTGDSGSINTNTNSYKIKSKESKRVKVIISENNE